MSNPTLDNYHTEATPTDPFHRTRVEDHRAPGGLVLVGTVNGHPRHADGEIVMTAPLTWHAAKGRTTPTDSGTVYELLTPDPKWVAWMKENGIPFDEDNPMRLVGESEIAARELGDQ